MLSLYRSGDQLSNAPVIPTEAGIQQFPGCRIKPGMTFQ